MARLSELLVSISIVSIATLMQPFDVLIGRAREVEAKIVVSTIDMMQQPFLIENQRFASSLKELELGIPSETVNYEYKVFALDETQAQVTARAKQRSSRSYAGTISLSKDNTLGNSIAAVVCETEQPSQSPPLPQTSGQEVKCPAGSKQLVGTMSL